MEILRRIGTRPLHLDCDCPRSWQQVVFATDDGNFAVHLDTLYPTSQHTALTEEIRSLPGDGSGGIAPYERMGVIGRAALTSSTWLALYQTGVDQYPDGSMQEPLFVNPLRPAPARI